MAKPMIAIDRRISVGEDPASAQARFNAYFASWLSAGGFQLVNQAPQSVTFERRRFFTWQIVVAVLLFPIGLIGLAADKRVERLIIYVVPEGDGSVITISGSIAPGAGTPQFAARLDEFDPAVTGESAGSPPSGWYRDPDTPGSQRFWDGATWTDERR